MDYFMAGLSFILQMANCSCHALYINSDPFTKQRTVHMLAY